MHNFDAYGTEIFMAYFEDDLTVRDGTLESSEIFDFLSEFCRWIILEHLLLFPHMWCKFNNIYQCWCAAKLFYFYGVLWDTHMVCTVE